MWTIINPDNKKRGKILKEVCKKNSEWKRYMVSIVVMTAFSVITLIYGFLNAILSSRFDIGEKIVLICSWACIACLLFIFALQVKNNAMFYCSLPYSCMTNGKLWFGESGSSFGYKFLMVGPRYSDQHKKQSETDDFESFTWIIKKENIEDIIIENGICTVKGKSEIANADWAVDKGYSRLKSMDTFSFVLAFEEDDIEKIISEWREKK